MITNETMTDSEKTAILRAELERNGCKDADRYEWYRGEALWYGEPLPAYWAQSDPVETKVINSMPF